jgi:hypothetical protein
MKPLVAKKSAPVKCTARFDFDSIKRSMVGGLTAINNRLSTSV